MSDEALRCTRFHAARAQRLPAERDAVLAALNEVTSGDVVWLELTPAHSDLLAEAVELLSLPRLALRGALRPRKRARFERYPQCALFVLKMLSHPALDLDDDTGIATVDAGELTLLVTERVVITYRDGPVEPLDQAHRRAAEHAHLLDSGAAALAYLIADVLVDSYGEVSGRLGQDLVDLEQRVFAPNRDDVSGDLFTLKRKLLTCQDAVDPLLPTAHGFVNRSGGRGRLHQHFRDVADRLIRVSTEARSTGELLDSALNVQFSRAGLWQNEDMRRISAWGAIALVPTIVTSMYGMNFQHMPELNWTVGYPLSLLVVLVVCTALYLNFRRNNWL